MGWIANKDRVSDGSLSRSSQYVNVLWGQSKDSGGEKKVQYCSLVDLLAILHSWIRKKTSATFSLTFFRKSGLNKINIHANWLNYLLKREVWHHDGTSRSERKY